MGLVPWCSLVVVLLSVSVTTGNACGGSHVVQDQPIIFSSPNYGGSSYYRRNTMCYWLFKAYNQQPLRLTFLDVNMEGPAPFCYTSYVVVYTGSCGSSPPTKLCGWTLPDPVTSEGGQLCVMFRSKSMDAFGGFNASVELVEKSTLTTTSSTPAPPSTQGTPPPTTTTTKSETEAAAPTTETDKSSTTTSSSALPPNPSSSSVSSLTSASLSPSSSPFSSYVSSTTPSSSTPTSSTSALPQTVFTKDEVSSSLSSTTSSTKSSVSEVSYSSSSVILSNTSPSAGISSSLSSSSTEPSVLSQSSTMSHVPPSQSSTMSHVPPSQSSTLSSAVTAVPQSLSTNQTAQFNTSSNTTPLTSSTTTPASSATGVFNASISATTSSHSTVTSSPSSPTNTTSSPSTVTSSASATTSSPTNTTSSPSTVTSSPTATTSPPATTTTTPSTTTSPTTTTTSSPATKTSSPTTTSSSPPLTMSSTTTSTSSPTPTTSSTASTSSFPTTATTQASTLKEIGTDSTPTSTLPNAPCAKKGYTVVTSSGTVTSPNFLQGKLYPNNARCLWKIVVPEGGTVTFTFTSLDVEYHHQCRYDAVTIFPATHTTTATTTHTSASTSPTSPSTAQSATQPPLAVATNQTFCGVILPAEGLTFHSDTFVEFTSDFFVPRPGFAANVVFTNPPATTIPEATTSSSTLPPVGKVEMCKDTTAYVEGEVYVISPDYDAGQYPVNVKCDLTVATTPGKKLRVQFLDMSLEYHRYCQRDRLTVYDGNVTQHAVLATCCGATPPSDHVTTLTSLLSLEFVSDPIIPDRGFRLQVSAVDDDNEPSTETSATGAPSYQVTSSPEPSVSTRLQSASPLTFQSSRPLSILSSSTQPADPASVRTTPSSHVAGESSPAVGQSAMPSSSVSPVSEETRFGSETSAPSVLHTPSPSFSSSISSAPTSSVVSSIPQDNVSPSSVREDSSTAPSLESSFIFSGFGSTPSLLVPGSGSVSSLFESTPVLPEVVSSYPLSESSLSPSLQQTATFSPVQETTPSSSVLKTTPFSSELKTTPSSSVLETTPSLSVLKTTPSSSVPETTPFSSELKTTPSSSVLETTSFSSVLKTTPSSSVPESTPFSSELKTTPSSSVLETTPSLSVLKTTPSSSVPESTPFSSELKITPSSSVLETTPSLSVLKTTPSSSVPETTPFSSELKTTPSSSVLETTSFSSVLKTTPSSSVPESTPFSSELKTTPSSSVLETTPSLSVLKTTPSSSVPESTPFSSELKTTPSSSVLETTPSLSVLKTTPSSSVPKTTPFSSELKTTPSSSVLETTSFSSVLKSTPSPSMLNTTPSSSEVKTTPSSSVLETTSSSLSLENVSSVSTPPASATAIPPSPISAVTTMATKPSDVSTTPGKQNYTFGDACSGVPAMMARQAGEITSPGFLSEQSYPNNVNCQWIIQVPPFTMVRLKFTVFDLEFQQSCSFDRLSVWKKEPQTGSLLHSFCGSSLPTDVTSDENLVLVFTSDRVGRRSGFRAEYELIHLMTSTPDPCPSGRSPCQSGLCIPHQWFCDGEQDCPAADDEEQCDVCQDGEFQCLDKSCLPAYNVCDGTAHCSDREDEEQCVRESSDGYLQVNKEGNWLPVCSEGWTPELADGACSAAGQGTLVESGAKAANSSNSSLFAFWKQEYADMYVQARGAVNLSTQCPSNEVVTIACEERVCGRAASPSLPQPFVLGSQQSVDGQWPWTVAVMAGTDFKCGGSLIMDTWVLTAAHCVYNLINVPERLHVISGHVNLRAPTRQETRVTEIVIHPDNDYIYNADISLMRLQRPLEATPTVRPACLPSREHEWNVNISCYVSGWGVRDLADLFSRKTSSVLHHAKVKLWDQTRCQQTYKSRLRQSMICAGYDHGELDACKGDSGGPLVCQTVDGAWTQVGVVSWGEGCGSKRKPGVYTRVDSFLGWINNVTAQDEVQVSCDFETPSICGYVSLANDTSSFLWSRRKGGQWLPARPNKDHTRSKDESGHYMYTHVAYENKQQNATLYTPTMPRARPALSCFSFHVLFFAGTDASLTVYAIGRNASQSQQLLRLKNEASYWLKVEAEVPGWAERVSFLSSAQFRTDGGVAIDDVSFVNGRCPDMAKLSCDFNDGTLCQYNQSEHDTADWLLQPSTLKSASGEKGGYYLQANLSGSPYGSIARFASPVMTSSVLRCLHFRYKLTPANGVTLSVCTMSVVNGNRFIDCDTWSRSNSAGGDWAEGRASIGPSAYPYAVVFHARRGVKGGVASIDNITKVDGSCD